MTLRNIIGRPMTLRNIIGRPMTHRNIIGRSMTFRNIIGRPTTHERRFGRSLLRVSILGTALVLMGMNQLPFCNDTQTDPGRGNLDRISDIVVVQPSNDGLAPSVFVVSANPAIKQLRIYETLNRRFEDSPNGFFPLSLETGPSTRRLCKSAGDETRLFTLDSSEDLLHVVRTRASPNAEAFTYVGAGVRTGRAPTDIAAIALDDDVTVVAVTIPDESLVELYDIDIVSGELLAFNQVALPNESFPARVASDPSGDAFVVTDAVLNEVHIIRADTRELDRSLNVGGPTFELATGLIDPGDGLAPVALVLRRDIGSVTAIRMFRPSYREDRYAVLAHTDLPELGAVAFVPEQVATERTDPTICCPGVIAPGEASRAWSVVVTETGRAIYLRLDGERGGTDGVMRLFDNDEAPPGLADRDGIENPTFFAGDGALNTEPTLVVTAADTLGTPPNNTYLREPTTVTFTYEGAPPRTSNRTASWTLGAIEVTPDSRPFEERDVLVGDDVFIATAGRSDVRCPEEGFLRKEITAIDGDRISVAELSTDDTACLQLFGDFSIAVRAKGVFVVEQSPGGYLGRLSFADQPTGVTAIRVPNMFLELLPSDDGLPASGAQLVAELADNLSPIGMYLAQEIQFNDTTGFDLDALVPTAIGGHESFLPGTNDGDAARPVRRVFLSTAGVNGRIIEFNETETVLSFVNSDIR